MKPQPIVHLGIACLSLRQLDELNGFSKGASFRAFKRVRDQLQEGHDYFYLPADEYAARVQALREAGLIYASTTHLLLLTRRGYERMAAARLE